MIKCLIVSAALMFLSACSTQPAPVANGPAESSESGQASFYAMKFQSRTTASGEPFDQAAMTAAHKHLPFGTRVKVTNTANGKHVIVRINDRGPFVAGRIIDLSRTAFDAIANLGEGIIDVTVEVVR